MLSIVLKLEEKSTTDEIPEAPSIPEAPELPAAPEMDELPADESIIPSAPELGELDEKTKSQSPDDLKIDATTDPLLHGILIKQKQKKPEEKLGNPNDYEVEQMSQIQDRVDHVAKELLKPGKLPIYIFPPHWNALRELVWVAYALSYHRPGFTSLFVHGQEVKREIDFAAKRYQGQQARIPLTIQPKGDNYMILGPRPDNVEEVVLFVHEPRLYASIQRTVISLSQSYAVQVLFGVNDFSLFTEKELVSMATRPHFLGRTYSLNPPPDYTRIRHIEMMCVSQMTEFGMRAHLFVPWDRVRLGTWNERDPDALGGIFYRHISLNLKADQRNPFLDHKSMLPDLTISGLDEKYYPSLGDSHLSSTEWLKRPKTFSKRWAPMRRVLVQNINGQTDNMEHALDFLSRVLYWHQLDIVIIWCDTKKEVQLTDDLNTMYLEYQNALNWNKKDVPTRIVGRFVPPPPVQKVTDVIPAPTPGQPGVNPVIVPVVSTQPQVQPPPQQPQPQPQTAGPKPKPWEVKQEMTEDKKKEAGKAMRDAINNNPMSRLRKVGQPIEKNGVQLGGLFPGDLTPEQMAKNEEHRMGVQKRRG